MDVPAVVSAAQTGGGVMAGGLGVKAGAEKIKDVLTPKEEEGPKVELPPGAERE